VSTSGILASLHPLYLNQSPLHRRCLSNLAGDHLEGVVDAYMQHRRNVSFVNLHYEQLFFTFVHYQATGSSVWIILAPGQMDKTDELAAKRFRALYPHSELTNDQVRIVARTLLFSKMMFPSTQQLHDHHIAFSLRTLSAGQVMMARGDMAHCGFSTANGDTISFACNLITEEGLTTTLVGLREHLRWMRKLRALLRTPAGRAWYHAPAPTAPETTAAAATCATVVPFEHSLPSPADMVRNAIFFAPMNFTCAWLRGLRADLRLLLPLVDADSLPPSAEPICEYPLLQQQARAGQFDDTRTLLALCADNFTKLHQLYDFVQALDTDPAARSCEACRAIDTDGKTELLACVHTCKMCACPLVQCHTEEWRDQQAHAQQQREESPSQGAVANLAATSVSQPHQRKRKADAGLMDSSPVSVVAARHESSGDSETVHARPSASAGNKAQRCAAAASSLQTQVTVGPQVQLQLLQSQPEHGAANSGASLPSLSDSTALWVAGDYEQLREQLLQDGYIFLRGVISKEVVQQAEASFRAVCGKPAEATLLQERMASSRNGSTRTRAPLPAVAAAAGSVAWDAQTGVNSKTHRASKKALAVGNSEEMRQLYVHAVSTLCHQLLRVESGSSSRSSHRVSSKHKASASPGHSISAATHVLLSDCTWMRVLRTNGCTRPHSDLMYFLQHTDRLWKIYQQHPPCRSAVAEERSSRSQAEIAAACACSADRCSSDAVEAFECAACRRAYHLVCCPSLSVWRASGAPIHRWHCDECVNAPSPFFTCWMPLTSLNADASRLQVLPGSHRLRGYERMQPDDGGDMLPGDYTPAHAAHTAADWRTAPADMAAGDCIIFNFKLVHAATEHRSTQPRLSVDTRIAWPSSASLSRST